MIRMDELVQYFSIYVEFFACKGLEKQPTTKLWQQLRF